MNQEWKLTQKQFDWLVDIIMSPNRYSSSIRQHAMRMLKTYGLKGWYNVDGKMALNTLAELVREFNHRFTNRDDLPF